MTLFPLLMHLKCQKTHTPIADKILPEAREPVPMFKFEEKLANNFSSQDGLGKDAISIFQHGETSSGQNDFLTICQYLASTTHMNQNAQ